METPPEAIEQLLSITVPNSRQVRWRFAQVAKIFGILRHGVDPCRINLQALLRKYRGTVVMEEVLSKLFHERMDVKGATDVLRGLQSGVLSLEITSQGPLGLSNRTQDDMLLPNWDNAALRGASWPSHQRTCGALLPAMPRRPSIPCRTVRIHGPTGNLPQMRRKAPCRRP